MKAERIACGVLAVVAAALAVFGATRQMRVRELDARIDSVTAELSAQRDVSEGLRGELDAARRDADDRIGTLEGERDALARELEDTAAERDGMRRSLDELGEKLSQAEDELQTLSAQHPFDPDGPEYQQLYPDFYAPQPIIADGVASKVMYLTFDDGPSERTDEILATLAAEDVKATFFIVGSAAEWNRDKVREIYAAGHTVGMHSYSHDYYDIYSSVEAFLDDMYKVFCIIRDETGVAPTYFRFPGGSNNGYAYEVIEEIMAEMLRRGFVPCDWNLSSGDAAGYTVSVEAIISNILQNSDVNRGFVLMHDSYYKTTTAQALPEVIAGLKERGFTFAPLTPEVKPVIFGYAHQFRTQ